MTFREYCRGMSQHELLNLSILPKANKVKKVFSFKTRTEVDTIHCSPCRLHTKFT